VRNCAEVRRGSLGAGAAVLILVACSGCGHSGAVQAGATSGGVQCGPPPSIAPVANSGPPLLPGEFTVQSTLRDHFGERFGMVWLTRPKQPDGSDERVIVAVVSPSDGDRAYVRSIPDIGGRIDVVESKYSDAQLQQFQSDLAPFMSESTVSSSKAAAVVSTGSSVRDENFTETGEPVVTVGVTACDPVLIQRLVALVPSDVLQLEIEQPRQALTG